MFDIDRAQLTAGIQLIELLTAHAAIFPSKGEARRMLQGGGLSLNKEKISDPDMIINSDILIRDRYILIQKGKKQYYLISVI